MARTGCPDIWRSAGPMATGPTRWPRRTTAKATSPPRASPSSSSSSASAGARAGSSSPATSAPPTQTAPPAARGDQAYAVGTVDGTTQSGWAKQQTVILAQGADGKWRLLGAPRDADGRIANPHLRAIAALSDGSGYAVGDRGTVVAFAA